MKLEYLLMPAAVAAFACGCASSPPRTAVGVKDQATHTEVTVVPAYLPEPRYSIDEPKAAGARAYTDSAACPAELHGIRVDAVPSRRGMTLVIFSELGGSDVGELRERARRLADIYNDSSTAYSVSTEYFERGIKLVFEVKPGGNLSELRSTLFQHADTMNNVKRCPLIGASFGPGA